VAQLLSPKWLRLAVLESPPAYRLVNGFRSAFARRGENLRSSNRLVRCALRKSPPQHATVASRTNTMLNRCGDRMWLSAGPEARRARGKMVAVCLCRGHSVHAVNTQFLAAPLCHASAQESLVALAEIPTFSARVSRARTHKPRDLRGFAPSDAKVQCKNRRGMEAMSSQFALFRRPIGVDQEDHAPRHADLAEVETRKNRYHLVVRSKFA
jgi:hypothetical protein